MRLPKLWLAVVLALTGSMACSAEPLVPDGKGGTSGGAAGMGGAAGTSASGGTTGNAGAGGSECGPPPPIVPCRVGRTVVECVINSMAAHWSVSCPDDPTGAGGSTGSGGAGGGVACASTGSCAMGEVCSTENGICNAPPGCNMGVACPAVCYGTCVRAQDGSCMTDADCRVEADYCTGCDCRALATGQSVPPCSGPGVRCLRDPCSGAKAACVNGACVVQ